MKKITTLSIVFLCLSLFTVSHSYGQDTRRQSQAQDMENDEADDSTNMSKDEAGIKQKNRRPEMKVHFGIEAGVNLADQSFKSDGISYTENILAGGRAGFLFDMPLSRKINAQLGAYYVMDGSKWSANSNGTDNNYSATYNFNTIQVPLTILYKTGHPGGNRFFVGAGPYIGYIINGSIKNSSTKSDNENLKFGTDVTTDNFAALDYGIDVKVGFELSMGLFIKAGYTLGLANLVIDPPSGTSLYDYSYNAGIGYFFGKKSAHRKMKHRDNNDVEMQM